MVFEESREKKRTRRWKWKSEEEVKEFQYLGYIFKKDTSYKGQLENLKRKANAAMKQI